MNKYYNTNMKIYVLHYSKLTDRKSHILSQFKKHGIQEFEIIERFDKDEITDEQCTLFDPNYVTNKRAQLSLHLKHLYVYERIITEDIEEALILEDDVILSDNFIHKLTEYMTQLPNNYDMLFIGDGCQLHIPANRIVPNQYIYDKCVDINEHSHGATRCTDSYVIHNRCAKKICEYLTKLNYKIDLPVDWWLNIAARDNNLSIYWGEPTIVTQGSHVGLFATSI
jgi:glycosyl transferase, family 25